MKKRTPEQIIEGFFNGFDAAKSGCWLWKRINKGGYGIIQIHRKSYYAHRYSYELFNTAIPEGKVIDHLCKTRNCVNPLHLEVVSAKENTLRGNSLTNINSLKTQCNKGHVFSSDNVYLYKNKRHCIKCRSIAGNKYRAKKLSNTRR